jgi:hypothetical protein
MACAQLVVRHIQRTQQISNHYLRRKWLVWRLKRGTKISKESRKSQRIGNILPMFGLCNEILFLLLGFPWGWQMLRFVGFSPSSIRTAILWFL